MVRPDSITPHRILHTPARRLRRRRRTDSRRRPPHRALRRTLGHGQFDARTHRPRTTHKPMVPQAEPRTTPRRHRQRHNPGERHTHRNKRQLVEHNTIHPARRHGNSRNRGHSEQPTPCHRRKILHLRHILRRRRICGKDRHRHKAGHRHMPCGLRTRRNSLPQRTPLHSKLRRLRRTGTDTRLRIHHISSGCSHHARAETHRHGGASTSSASPHRAANGSASTPPATSTARRHAPSY